jgi:hypothetical protein
MADHFWLFMPGDPVSPDEADPLAPEPFTSLDEARERASSLPSGADIFSTPMSVGGWSFVEHVEPRS